MAAGIKALAPLRGKQEAAQAKASVIDTVSDCLMHMHAGLKRGTLCVFRPGVAGRRAVTIWMRQPAT